MPSSQRKTPRDHLSWSQMFLFENDEDAWVRKYIYGEEIVTPQMEFGKRIAEGLEESETSDAQIEYLRTFLPEYPYAEYELKVNYKGIPLIGKLDKCDPARGRIGEIKTGRQPWTQTRVDRHGQLTWYAWMLFLTTRKLPAEIALFWAPTGRDAKGGFHLSGEIRTFYTERGLIEFAQIAERAQEAWAGIIKITKTHYSQIA